MECVVFIATSLDGYIARADGSLDWLPQPSGEPNAEDYGYVDLFDSVDALLMGRNTFDLVQSFDEWPYGEKPVFVLTSRPLEGAPATVENINLQPSALVEALAARGMKRLYIDGGNTIQQFLAANLVTEIIITRIPVLIGNGIPLFGPLDNDIHLAHLKTTAYDSGFVQSHYRVM